MAKLEYKIKATELEEVGEILDLLRYLYDRAEIKDKEYADKKLDKIFDKLGMEKI